jgi:hypothetical protein
MHLRVHIWPLNSLVLSLSGLPNVQRAFSLQVPYLSVTQDTGGKCVRYLVRILIFYSTNQYVILTLIPDIKCLPSIPGGKGTSQQTGSLYSSVDIVTRLQDKKNRGYVVRIPARARDFTLPRSVQTVSGAHAPSCSMCTVVSFPGVKPVWE